MDIKKRAFLDAYKTTFGNISQACQIVKMSRQVYYNWKKEDKEFAEALNSVEPEEVFIDFAENALTQRIQKGDTTAIIFALKTKGKKRGYVEKQEINQKTTIESLPTLKIEYVKPDEG